MEQLFKVNPLQGAYLEAFEDLKEELGLDEKESEVVEAIIGLVQLIATVEKTPLLIELESLKEEHKRLTVENQKLTIENSNLLNSLKAMKEISIINDKIEGTTLECRPNNQHISLLNK